MIQFFDFTDVIHSNYGFGQLIAFRSPRLSPSLPPLPLPVSLSLPLSPSLPLPPTGFFLFVMAQFIHGLFQSTGGPVRRITPLLRGRDRGGTNP